MDFALKGVAIDFPSGYFGGKERSILKATIEALTAQDSKFGLGHVQPTAMLGRVMDFQFVENPAGLFRRERLVKRGRFMRVKVVLHQYDLFRGCVMHVNQLANDMRIIQRRPALRDLHMSLTGQRLEHHKHIRGAVPLVLIVGRRRASRSGWNRQSGLFDELLRCLVKTHHRPLRVERTVIHLQHILHRAYKLCVFLRWNHPLAMKPRLDFVFFSRKRTVSSLIESTTSNCTSLSASSCSVQRARPSGGSLQANATNLASFSPSSLGNRGRDLGLRTNAASNPSSTSRCRKRWIVDSPTSNASEIFSSVQPGPQTPTSALSSIRARSRLSAAARRSPTTDSNVTRSSFVNRTTYLASLPILRLPSNLPRERSPYTNYPKPVNFNLVDH